MGEALGAVLGFEEASGGMKVREGGRRRVKEPLEEVGLSWVMKGELTSSRPRERPESLQSWPTLCNAIDGSPPGSPVPGILQARTLEWVAISFSNA